MASQPFLLLTQPDHSAVRVMIQHLVSWTEQQVDDGYGGTKKVTRVTTTMGSYIVVERAVDIAYKVKEYYNERT